jgi:hypothetical protein
LRERNAEQHVVAGHVRGKDAMPQITHRLDDSAGKTEQHAA